MASYESVCFTWQECLLVSVFYNFYISMQTSPEVFISIILLYIFNAISSHINRW